MNDVSFFIISGLYEYQSLNTVLIQARANFPNKFIPNRQIRGVYGNFPNAIWNGEDMVFSSKTLLMPQIIESLSLYNKMHLQIYLNCTNSEIQDKHCYDTYCNLILKHTLNSNFFNACVINSPFLNDYLLQKYPELINRIIGKNNEINSEHEKEVSMPFFLNPKFNNNFEELKNFRNKNDIYITINPYCITCPTFQACLYKENLAQLTYDDIVSKRQTCQIQTKIQHRESQFFITNEQIEEYINLFYRHFILEQMPTPEQQIEEYLYYFVKPEFYNDIKDYFYNHKESFL